MRSDIQIPIKEKNSSEYLAFLSSLLVLFPSRVPSPCYRHPGTMERHPFYYQPYPSQPLSSFFGQPSTNTDPIPPTPYPHMLLAGESSNLPPPGTYVFPGCYGDDDHRYFESFPPGYRFHPTDEELLVLYLTNKVLGKPLPRNRIPVVKLYDYNPETLAARYDKCNEKTWYFFTLRDKKYPNGSRPKRSASDGYWKSTGADKPVKDEGGRIVGYKRALVFYLGKPPNGEKTNWIMHEYSVSERVQRSANTSQGNGSVNPMLLAGWVLCTIYKKDKREKNKNSDEPGRPEEDTSITATADQPERPEEDTSITATADQPERPAIAPSPPPPANNDCPNFGDDDDEVDWTSLLIEIEEILDDPTRG